MFAGRSVATKKAFLMAVAANLGERCGISPQDIEITITETPRENWLIRGLPADELTLPTRSRCSTEVGGRVRLCLPMVPPRDGGWDLVSGGDRSLAPHDPQIARVEPRRGLRVVPTACSCPPTPIPPLYPPVECRRSLGHWAN